MKRDYKPIDWSNFTPLEECTNFGNANDNKLDIAIDDIDQRMIKYFVSKKS